MKLDLRALALMRIGLGLLVLLDLLLRCQDLTAFYTDRGVLPRSVLLQVPHSTWVSLYLMAGTSFGVGLLMLCQALSAVALTVGWQTRWAALATWVFHAALKHRNPLILDAGDLELGLLLWWCIWLPVGRRYSLDGGKGGDLVRNWATGGYLLQMGLIYLMAAWTKSDPVWRESGLALYYVFNLDSYATGVGRWLLQYPDFLRGLTFAALATEFSIPVLLWLPWRFTRLLGCLAILGFHLGIALTLKLGLMVPVALVGSLGLWPLPRPTPGPSVEQSRWEKGLLGAVCVYIVYLNLAASVWRQTVVPYPVKLFGYLTQQQQDWPLFAPHPGGDDARYRAWGECRNGERVDLLEGHAGQRWHLWLVNLGERHDQRVFPAFVEWLAREWNSRHLGPQTVRRLTLVQESRTTRLPGEPPVVGNVTLYDYAVPLAPNQAILEDQK